MSVLCRVVQETTNGVSGKIAKTIAVFSEKTDVPHLPNQSMVAIISHEAVTLKIRSRSSNSNKLLILSD